MNILRCVIFCSIASGLSFASPYSFRPKKSDLQRYLLDDTNSNDMLFPVDTESYRSKEQKPFDALVKDLLDELPDEEPDLPALAKDMEVLDQLPLSELEALEEAVQDDGFWMDNDEELEDVDDSLPPNYHNSSEFETKLGNEEFDVLQTIDKATDKNGKSTAISEFINSFPANEETEFSCSLKRPCADDQYCFETQYNSECLPCLSEGSDCVDDAQCCSSGKDLSICVDGTCAVGILPGSAGTICETADDCLPGTCCASVQDFPRKLCKPMAKLNERCSPPPVLSDIMILNDKNYYCPCERELICKAKQAIVYDVIPVKYSEGHFCSASPDSKSVVAPHLEDDNLASRSSPGFDELLQTLKEARAESEEDQRFVNPANPKMHRDSKKAMEITDPEDFMM